MNKTAALLVTGLFLGLCLALLVNHLIDFKIRYFKYASSFLIKKWHLQYGYFFMIAVEAVSICIVLFKPKQKFLLRVYDIMFSIYIAFLVVCLACIYEITNGCIDCHFIARAFFDDYIISLVTVLAMAALYLFGIRKQLYQQV